MKFHIRPGDKVMGQEVGLRDRLTSVAVQTHGT